MPWFALDDGFDTHPKVRKAGNAAVGLFVRLGVHATKHLTEGHLDGAIVRDYGTDATVRKLITVGMLHGPGHACQRCPQPAEDGYFIHDYLDYNKSRAQIEAAREAARKRQQRGRDSASRNRNERDSGANLNGNSRENGAGFAPNSRQNDPRFQDGTAGHSDASRRDTHEGATGVPSPPLPSQPLSGAERDQGDRSDERTPEPALSLIPPTWTPHSDDIRTAQQARIAAGRPTLTGQQIHDVTRKFVRRQTADRREATNWGSRWQEWAERERPSDTGQAPLLIGLNGGGEGGPAWPHEIRDAKPKDATPTPPSYAERMAQLDAAAERDRARDGETG